MAVRRATALQLYPVCQLISSNQPPYITPPSTQKDEQAMYEEKNLWPEKGVRAGLNGTVLIP